MKAVAFVGSPRKNGNTEILSQHTLKAIQEEGLETELIRLADFDVRPCNACMACREEERCSIKDDLLPLYFKAKAADAIILASPGILRLSNRPDKGFHGTNGLYRPPQADICR